MHENSNLNVSGAEFGLCDIFDNFTLLLSRMRVDVALLYGIHTLPSQYSTFGLTSFDFESYFVEDLETLVLELSLLCDNLRVYLYK